MASDNQWCWPLAESSWDKEEEATIVAVLRSGRVTMGARVEELEYRIAEMHERRYAVMTNSGSSANLLAVAALKHRGRIAAGDLALVPAIAWSTTYAPLIQLGLRPVVIDVESETLNVNLALLQTAFEKTKRGARRASLLVGVSVLGNPAPLEFLRGFSLQHGMAFLEDNCESFGARYREKLCGTFGDVSTLSTFFSHQLNTGEGGFLLTDDKGLYELALCLRAHGWTRDLPIDHAWRTGEEPGEYRFILPGYNLRPTEIAAAAGLVQLQKFPAATETRQCNAALFASVLEDLYCKAREYLDPFRTPQLEPGAAPFGFVLIARDSQLKHRATQALHAVGIETRMVTGGCFTLQEIGRQYSGTPCWKAEEVHRRGFFVGNLARDLTKEIGLLRSVIESFL